jgi:flagellar hook-associated protein 2
MSTSSIDLSNTTSGNGLDVTATVDQLMQAERAPERLWQQQQQAMAAQATALRNMNSQLDTLESRINDLHDLSGVFGQNTATSSNESALSASAASGAGAGQHIITVTQLATVASQYADALASADSTFTPGELQFQIGTGDIQTITFDQDHSTLKTAVDEINSSNLGITASLLTDAVGTHLVLVSSTSGSAGDLTITSAPTGLTFHTGSAGQDAKLTIDGVPIVSATNDISGAIPGVTLTLNGDTSGTPVRLTIGADNSGIQTAVNNFVSAYNTIVNNINSQFAYNSATKSAGTLAGDSSVRSLQSTLLGLAAFQSTGSGSITTLRSLGITMRDDGTLQVNDSTLSNTIKNDASDVQKFFQGGNNDGFAATLSTKLSVLTDPTSGPLLVDAKGMDDSVSSLQKQIEDFEVQMSAKEQQLIDEYSRIDTMLRSMSTIMQSVQAQLGTLSTS